MVLDGGLQFYWAEIKTSSLNHYAASMSIAIALSFVANFPDAKTLTPTPWHRQTKRVFRQYARTEAFRSSRKSLCESSPSMPRMPGPHKPGQAQYLPCGPSSESPHAQDPPRLHSLRLCSHKPLEHRPW